ncbi:hypothetical protein K450DRAFT_260819 [Umbelopsis ramanniana AG]|uniref:F-box domain-containing protein n=1 Tax=Umbelopsis ramanniana AG TaxID=1314678 RepID=A0AAD5HAY8_UMBRA|nr:uncharacterized protein K450DRAFT_260819 [Umbelopsis ramanniana AG]KAI8575643.1 hypothetical protein K450DRAFT_260819 [Umbelopsis ramanniana AG]
MPHSSKRNRNLPLEIAQQIAELLTARDLINAGSSWSFFYASFSSEKIWQTAYTKLLDGYPIDQFVITDAVRNVKRLKFIQFDALEDSKFCHLEDWVQSWKQRCVFAVHILHVQGQMVSVARQKSEEFKPPRSTPLYDSAFIQSIEAEAGAPLPIDFVLYLLNFAHHLTCGVDKNVPKMGLASGSTFTDESNWRRVIKLTQFRNKHEADHDFIQEERLEGLSEATIDFLNHTKIVCFSLTEHRYNNGLEYLSLLVSTKSDLQDQLPPFVDKDTLHVDLQAMDKGIGKVFTGGMWATDTFHFRPPDDMDDRYQLFPTAESFTDYWIQYIATIITIGKLPSLDMPGYNDLMTGLPRSPGIPMSVLLPQGKGWSVANYLPIYYSWESQYHFPSFNAYLEDQYSRPSVGVTKAFDNPENVQFPHIPIDITSGFNKRHWKPYWQHLMSLIRMDLPASFVHLQNGEMPEALDINSAIYQVQQRMIDDWIKSTPSSVKEHRQPSDFEMERTRKATNDLMPLIKLVRERLPIVLYYEPAEYGISQLLMYKYLVDHLSSLEQKIYKYSAEDLVIVEHRLRHHLYYWRRDCKGHSDAAGLEIDWTEV